MKLKEAIKEAVIEAKVEFLKTATKGQEPKSMAISYLRDKDYDIETNLHGKNGWEVKAYFHDSYTGGGKAAFYEEDGIYVEELWGIDAQAMTRILYEISKEFFSFGTCGQIIGDKEAYYAISKNERCKCCEHRDEIIDKLRRKIKDFKFQENCPTIAYL